MLGDFPYRTLILAPFGMCAGIGAATYTAARLVAENSDDPHKVGVAAAGVAVAFSLTYLGHAALIVTGDIAKANAEARAIIAQPVEPPKEFRELRQDIRREPFWLVAKDGRNGQALHFNHATDTQLVTLALYVAAGDCRLDVNLWTTRIENRLTWSRRGEGGFEFFLRELAEQELAEADGDNHFTLTYRGKQWLSQLAARSGKPLPRWRDMYRGGKNAAWTYIHRTSAAHTAGGG